MANYVNGFYDPTASATNPYYYGVQFNPTKINAGETTLSPEDYKLLTEKSGGSSLVLTEEEAAKARCNHHNMNGVIVLEPGTEEGTLYCPICKETFRAPMNLSFNEVKSWVESGESILQWIKTFGNLPKEYAQIIYGSLGFMKKIPDMWKKAEQNLKTANVGYNNQFTPAQPYGGYAAPNYSYGAPIPPVPPAYTQPPMVQPQPPVQPPVQQPNPYGGYYQGAYNPYAALPPQGGAAYAQPFIQPMPSGGIMTSEFVQGGVVPQQQAATPSPVIPAPGPAVPTTVPSAESPMPPIPTPTSQTGVATTETKIQL